MNNLIDDIKTFLKDCSGLYPDNNTDIFKDLGMSGDDFHEMIEKYTKKYNVDMTDYLWYFHTDEEGQNFGELFFKPPYSKVERIPITPNILAKFAKTKKWEIEYPEHSIPTSRPDLLINQIIVIVVSICILVWLILKYLI